MSTFDGSGVLEIVRQLKQDGGARAHVPVYQDGRLLAHLVPVTWADSQDPEAIARLARWREGGAHGFPSQFPVTLDGTQRWAIKGLLELPDRLLFWVHGADGTPVGHVGLYRFDFDKRQTEIDNIVRGEKGILPGAMQAAVQTLIDWTFQNLGMETLFLRVFSDNAQAIRLYERCGFHETMRFPVARVDEPNCVRWVEVDGEYREPIERYFVTMRLPRAVWLQRNVAGAAA
jgi:RimJ/RimL family protein N-acetyltransferase